MSLRYSLINDGETSSITVAHGGAILVANSDHPNFKAIVAGALEGDEGIADLFDIGATVAKRFQRLTERVTLSGGHVYFDGEQVDNTLTTQILRFVDEGHDFTPLVNFMEKVATNPNDHSREQLYSWLQRHAFTLTDEGDIVAYKGVNRDENDALVSCTAGPAIVDGVEVNGHVPNPVGAIVEMPRSKVNHDPSQGCSTGLHVANWRYASTFGDTTLKVRVNPRDVVSVPTDCNWEKMRVCRYTVVEVVDSPVASALDLDDEENDDVYGEVPVTVTTVPDSNATNVAVATKVPYKDQTLRSLRTQAQTRQIRVDGRRPSHCSKAELVKALNRADKRKG